MHHPHVWAIHAGRKGLLLTGPGTVSVVTELCASYPKESRSAEVRRVAIILSALTLPIVALRCFSRWAITRQIWYDDWAVLVATVGRQHQ
jgi:hypothetical protein